MKIGIVTTWFDRGAAFVSKQFADILSEKNDIYIFARGGEQYNKNSDYWNKYPVYWSKRYSDSTTKISWPQFKKWVKNNKIDIVLFNEQQDWEIIVDAKNLNIKTVAYIDYYTQETIPFFKLYDAVICNTKRHLEVFKSHPQAFYVPWGTDIDIFKPDKNLTNQKNINEPVFFHSAGMGGVNLRKGTDILVKSFNEIKSDKAKLIIHSQASLDSYYSIKEIIKEDQRINFIHKTISPPGLYHLGNIYVYPTKLEGIGLTICEALSCGLPVITTNNQPMNEFVEHKKNGILVDIEKYIARPDGYYWPESICSKKSLTNALQYFIDNPDKISEYSKNARKISINNFNWRNNAKKLHTIFTEIKGAKENHIDFDLNKKALGYSFERREKVWSLRKKIGRKITRIFNQLT